MLEYETWLMSAGIKKNTVSFYNHILRTVYNRTAVEKKFVTQCYPFNLYMQE